MWRPGLPEILLVLVIVLLLFGPGRIAKLAKELGASITAFRDGLNGTGQNKEQPEPEKKDEHTPSDPDATPKA